MELQDQVLRFPLTNVLSRQIFEYTINGWNVLMMYDTGAQMPVWCRSVELFCSVFPDARKTDFYCEISGFGRETERSSVYIIPLFELNGANTSFQIKNLLVANLYKPSIGCDFLLSETMFSKTDTLTIRRGRRELCVSYNKINRPFVCSAMSKNKEAIGISVWAEDKESYTYA